MLRLGNGMMLTGLVGLVSMGSPLHLAVPMMIGAFFVGVLFPAFH